MNEKIRNHINVLFENAPKTRKAFELKEELLANSEERYQDLIASGVSDEDAIKNVINSIGNVSELFQGLEEANAGDNSDDAAKMKKAAIYKAVAIGIYIFSVAVFVFFLFIDESAYGTNRAVENMTGISMIYSYTNYKMLGFLLMIIIDIIPTCMLVYISSMYPRYRKQEDTVVEDFKEWKNGSSKAKSIKSAVTTVIWTSALLLYFAISFLTFAWYATWIIFLVAICVQAIIALLFRLKELN